MLRSYSKAVSDPPSELVHLYEILDALRARFGSETLARSTLKITKAQWSELSGLCNAAPLLQGRHRGEKIGQIREATTDELSRARRIARSMITAYITHLAASK